MAEKGESGPLRLVTPVSLVTGKQTGIPGEDPQNEDNTMERRFFVLLLAWTVVSLAQARRQRVAEVFLEKPMGPHIRLRRPGPPTKDCDAPPLLPILLPCGHLMGILAALVLYFLFFKGRGDNSDLDVLLDEALLRDISGVLFTIRCRLCQIIEDRKKDHQRFPSRSRAKSH